MPLTVRMRAMLLRAAVHKGEMSWTAARADRMSSKSGGESAPVQATLWDNREQATGFGAGGINASRGCGTDPLGYVRSVVSQLRRLQKAPDVFKPPLGAAPRLQSAPIQFLRHAAKRVAVTAQRLDDGE